MCAKPSRCTAYCLTNITNLNNYTCSNLFIIDFNVDTSSMYNAQLDRTCLKPTINHLLSTLEHTIKTFIKNWSYIKSYCQMLNKVITWVNIVHSKVVGVSQLTLQTQPETNAQVYRNSSKYTMFMSTPWHLALYTTGDQNSVTWVQFIYYCIHFTIIYTDS